MWKKEKIKMRNIFLLIGACALAEVTSISDLYANIGVRPDSTPHTRPGNLIPLDSRPDTYIPANSYAANYKPPSQPITMSVAETYCTCPTSHYYSYKNSTTNEDVYYKDNTFCAAGSNNYGMGCIYYAEGYEYIPCGYQMQAAICAPKACPPVSSNGYTYHYQVAVDSSQYTYNYPEGGSTSGTNYWTYCKPYSAERNLDAHHRENDEKLIAPSTGTTQGKQYRDQLQNDRKALENDKNKLQSNPLQTTHDDMETDRKTLRSDRKTLRSDRESERSTRQNELQTDTNEQDTLKADRESERSTRQSDKKTATRENLNETFYSAKDAPSDFKSSVEGTLGNAQSIHQSAQELHENQLHTLENLQSVEDSED